MRSPVLVAAAFATRRASSGDILQERGRWPWRARHYSKDKKLPTSSVLGQPRVVVIRKVVIFVHRLIKKALPDLVGPVLFHGPEGRLAVVVLVLRGLALDESVNL